MSSPEQTVVARLVTGAVIAIIGGIVWAAAQLEGQDWFRLVLGAIVFGLICYARACVRALVGVRKTKRLSTTSGAARPGLRFPGGRGQPLSRNRAASASSSRPLVVELRASGSLKGPR